MTKSDAIKTFFGDVRPVTTAELMELRKADPAGYDEIGQACLKALGENQ